MPFLGRDWRSDGDLWVKTEFGWEKQKIISQLTPRRKRTPSTESDCESDNCAELESHLSASPQPRLQIVPRRSPEIVRSVDLGEALRTLDFQNGVRDPRRFRYICKLLEVLIADHLTNLPGCVQKLVITLLEEVLDEVQKTQSHVDVIRTLLAHVEAILCDYHCWGHPLGSSQLWRERLTGLRDLLRRADNVVVEKCRSSGQGCRELSDIPPECIREIMAKLEHHRDLEAVGEAYPTLMGNFLQEQYVWRELTFFHFHPEEIEAEKERLEKKIPWKDLYHKLRRRYGLREKFSETVVLCQFCCSLFWPTLGHACPLPRDKMVCDVIPLTPRAFLQLVTNESGP